LPYDDLNDVIASETDCPRCFSYLWSYRWHW